MSKKKKTAPRFEAAAAPPHERLAGAAATGSPLQQAYGLVHQAAEILANQQKDSGAQVRERYLALVAQMQARHPDLESLGEAMQHFGHLTDNFAAGLFQCYDVEGLPCTNNDLEHCFGVARVHERRATGRRGAIPGVVVRGSVRVMAAVVTKQQMFTAEDLRPSNYQHWRGLRRQLQQREESRRQQWRFRKEPAAYLAALEARLLQ